MAHLRFKGFVLRTIDIGDADRLVSILSSDRGLIKAYARNARRQRSHLRLTTQNFAFCEFTAFQYRERVQIDEAEMIEPFLELQQDMDRLVCAAHLVEVLHDAAEYETERSDLYQLCAYSLESLRRRPDPLLVAHMAQLRILSMIGLAPRVDNCVICGHALTQRPSFSESAGGILCGRSACSSRVSDARPLDQATLDGLQHSQTATLQRLFAFQMEPGPRRRFIQLSRQYLIHQMEKPYHRLDMLMQLQDYSLDPRPRTLADEPSDLSGQSQGAAAIPSDKADDSSPDHSDHQSAEQSHGPSHCG